MDPLIGSAQGSGFLTLYYTLLGTEGILLSTLWQQASGRWLEMWLMIVPRGLASDGTCQNGGHETGCGYGDSQSWHMDIG